MTGPTVPALAGPLPAGPPTLAAGADIALLEPAYAGNEPVAEAVERSRRGRTGLYDVTGRRGGQVVAEFRGRSRTVRPPASA